MRSCPWDGAASLSAHRNPTPEAPIHPLGESAGPGLSPCGSARRTRLHSMCCRRGPPPGRNLEPPWIDFKKWRGGGEGGGYFCGLERCFYCWEDRWGAARPGAGRGRRPPDGGRRGGGASVCTGPSRGGGHSQGSFGAGTPALAQPTCCSGHASVRQTLPEARMMGGTAKATAVS